MGNSKEIIHDGAQIFHSSIYQLHSIKAVSLGIFQKKVILETFPEDFFMGKVRKTLQKMSRETSRSSRLEVI